MKKYLDQGFFKQQMNRFCQITKSNVEESVLMNEYYPNFKSFDQNRFAKIINHMMKTWSNLWFPLPADFNKSIQATIVNTYQPQPYKRDPNYGSGMKRVLWGFKIMDIIREQEFPGNNYKRDSKHVPMVEIAEHMNKLYKEMISSNKVFSIKNKKWIDKENALGGEYFHPVEFGLGRY